VTNRDDFVPHALIRGPFQHVGTEVYYWDRRTYHLCGRIEDPMCSIKHEDSLLLPLLRCGISKYICGHRTYFAQEQPEPPLLLHCLAEPSPPFLPVGARDSP